MLLPSASGRDKGTKLLKQNGDPAVTLEAVLEKRNLQRAFKQVVANKGSAGIDGMEVGELADWCRRHPGEITESVRRGTYKPQAVLRVLIPKEEKGKFRPLGIPTVIDRFVQ